MYKRQLLIFFIGNVFRRVHPLQHQIGAGIQAAGILGDIIDAARVIGPGLSLIHIYAMPYALSSINEQDWANNWKKYFKPIPVGERLLIKPSWEDVEDAQGRVILEIDPSSSFGTGTHATTQLCMEQLEKYLRPGDDVLDMGCGSGILGVAAMLLGAGSVTGVDIEQNAVETALENARRNGISQALLSVRQGNILEDSALRKTIGARQYDVILANIVAVSYTHLDVYKRQP